MDKSKISHSDQSRALWLSTFAFTLCFAVWTIFSIIGIRIKDELGLSESQFGLLVATPILTGSVSRIFLGIWTEKIGGRILFPIQMLLTAMATWLLASANTYPMLILAALGLGLAGGSFIIGAAYVAQWYPPKRIGTALGIFGAGNVGSAITTFFAPFLVVSFGWDNTARIYAVILALAAALYFLLAKTDPAHQKSEDAKAHSPTLAQQLAPLKNLQVWRFATYYFFVFGGFVALASYLPRYYVGAYDLALTQAGLLTTMFALPGSVFRAVGGWASDKWGARAVMYFTFISSLVILFMMSYPQTDYTIHGINSDISFSFGINLTFFVILTIALGFVMSLGKAAVYKHIPVYYPDHVGSVGGLVGMIGGLGGFFLPLTFGIFLEWTNIWTIPFMILFVLVLISTIWMHVAISRMDRRRVPGLAGQRHLSDLPEHPLRAR